jgi:hypothetical protein
MITRARFQVFEKIQKSGLTNMYDINEVRFIGISKYGQELTKKDCFDIMLHYDKYKQKYAKKD